MIVTDAPSFRKNRLVGILIVVLIHIAAGYAVFSGLGKAMISVIPKAMETKIIQDTQSTAPPPVAPPDLVAPPPPQINLALPSFAVTRPPSANAITQPASAVPAPIAPPKPRVEVPPVVDPERACTKPVYPAMSRRLNEAGTVTLMMLIDVSGRVVDTQVKSSSGYPRLDQAARETVTSCHFKPATVDGQPNAAWSLIRYQFGVGQ